MKDVLLDTHVLAEVMKSAPDARVVSFLSNAEDTWLSVITVHELDYGIERLPRGKRRLELETAVAALLEQYEDRVVPIGRNEARCAALLRADAQARGRVLHLADALIAGTAKAHDLTVATRNVSDFAGLGIAVSNPWVPRANEPISGRG